LVDVYAAVPEQWVGESRVTLLAAKGRPAPTERAWILPPGSRIGPATAAERQALQGPAMAGKYAQSVDRESAYEGLNARASAEAPAETGRAGPGQAPGRAPAQPAESGGLMDGLNEVLFGSTGPRGGRRDGVVQSVVKSTARTFARQLVRGVLGSLLGSRRR